MAYIKVIIIGGGFGGLNAALALKKADVDVLVIDKTNHHVFQPLLYQVASAELSPGNIATAIREVVRNQQNTSVIMANVHSIDKANHRVVCDNDEVHYYDYLVVAPGARHFYFGHDEWEKFAPGLKTIEDAITIREKILSAFELAERCDSATEAQSYLKFVIVGGGPTGVEMAGAIADIARKSMFKNFRKIKPEQSQIYLVESLDYVLPSYPERLSVKAKKDLEKLGVHVFTNARVTDINEKGVTIDGKFFDTVNVIWAAGNQASPLLKSLDVPLDRQGRVFVASDLTIPNEPNVFVIGDAAHFKEGDSTLPGIAPVAIQQGRYVAKIIKNRIPQRDRKPFKYHDKGNMATIGKAKAIATIGKFQFSGYLAWLMWCFIHILYLINFRNRMIVMMEWFFWYVSGKRNVRIITKPVNERKNKITG